MAVSYDSPAILKDFANRHKIEFPLVADPESKIISSFGVFNSQATGMTKGMAHPGFYFIDAAGVIRRDGDAGQPGDADRRGGIAGGRARLRAGSDRIQADSTDAATDCGGGSGARSIPQTDQSFFAGHQGNRAGVRGEIPDQPGCDGQHP